MSFFEKAATLHSVAELSATTSLLVTASMLGALVIGGLLCTYLTRLFIRRGHIDARNEFDQVLVTEGFVIFATILAIFVSLSVAILGYGIFALLMGIVLSYLLVPLFALIAIPAFDRLVEPVWIAIQRWLEKRRR